MSCSKLLTPMTTSLVITNSIEAFLWDSPYYVLTGISLMDLTCDIRNLTLGSGAAVAIKPALQFAPVRTDRPDAGAAITVGTVMTGNGVAHYEETISAPTKYYVRRGLSYRLTAGSFAQADIMLGASWIQAGLVGQSRQIDVMPTNSTAAVSYFSLLPTMVAVGVSKLKYALIGLDNLNNKMQFRAAGRAFNDPMARGSWIDLETGWNTPAAGDFTFISGEVDLSGLSLNANHLVEFALGVRKSADGEANSRVNLTIFPSILFG
jgi:hypothetical protein